MQTRSFVVSFVEIPVDLESVKSGRTTSAVVTACRLVNVGLFVSRDLRRDVEVTFAQGESRDLRLVAFSGATLKRVSPDERSVALFLVKAMAAAGKLEVDSYATMDNGIVVHRCPLGNLIRGWSSRPLFLASRQIPYRQVRTALDSNGVFIYDYAQTLTPVIEDHSPHLLPMSRTPERFVLEVNRQFDLQKDESSKKAS